MILHADFNSFFARVEQQSNPKLRNRPIGVLGKGHKGARTCVCAASPEAKKFGVKAGMSTWEARKLCPQIMLVPPDYPKYLAISRQFMEILESYTPWVEIFSIDEAFLDIKSEYRNPKSETNSSDAAVGIPTSADRRENNKFQINAQSLNNTGDSELHDAIVVAKDIKRRLRNEIGELVTVSIGIAWGKAFAKLASDMQKPDGLVILERDSWLEKVGDKLVTEVCGIGYRLTNHLAYLGITTIAHLAKADVGLLTARFGPSLGIWLAQFGQGIDPTPVKASKNIEPAKSIGHQLTLDTDTPIVTLGPVITKLALKVARRLRRHTQRAKQLSLSLALSGGSYWHTSLHRSPSVNTDKEILITAIELFASHPFARSTLVRRVGITSFDLEADVALTLPLFPDVVRDAQLTSALDTLRDRYGDQVVNWAVTRGIDVGNLRDWRGPRAVLGH